MRLDDRIAAVVAAAAEISWLVDLTFENISHWIELELGQYLKRSQASTVWEPALSDLSAQSHLAYCQREHAARGFAKPDPRRNCRRHQLDKVATPGNSRIGHFCRRIAETTAAGDGHRTSSQLDGGG